MAGGNGFPIQALGNDKNEEISRSLGIVVRDDKVKDEILNRSRIESGTSVQDDDNDKLKSPCIPLFLRGMKDESKG